MNNEKKYAEYVSAVEEGVQAVLDERFKGYDMQVTPEHFMGRNCHFLTVKGKDDINSIQFNLTTSFEKMANGLIDDLVESTVTSVSAIMEDLFSKSGQNTINLLTENPNYEKIKDKLRIRLISSECYRKYYGKALVRPFYDMYQMISISVDQHLIIFSHEHLVFWKVSENQVFADALSASMNAEKHVFVTVVDKLMSRESLMVEDYKKGFLWYCSNTSSLNGASVILYSDVLETIAEKLEDSFYVIPSSVHEVLIIAQKKAESAGLGEFFMENTIREINESLVDEKDRLSNKLYYYDHNTKTLTQCLGNES